MQAGDVGLMYTDRRFRFALRVYAKEQSASFARSAWGANTDGQTWENAYFVDVLPIDESLANVASALGYKQTVERLAARHTRRDP